MLEAKGMSMLLLKGESLAENYPQPDLRESGDVDFVARPDFEACNALMESLGIGLKSQEKHSTFEYKGVHFENHTLEPTGGYNRVHHRTMALLMESLPDAVLRSDGCLELECGVRGEAHCAAYMLFRREDTLEDASGSLPAAEESSGGAGRVGA